MQQQVAPAQPTPSTVLAAAASATANPQVKEKTAPPTPNSCILVLPNLDIRLPYRLKAFTGQSWPHAEVAFHMKILGFVHLHKFIENIVKHYFLYLHDAKMKENDKMSNL